VSAILATGLVVMAIYGVNRWASSALLPTHRQVHRGRATLVIVAALAVVTVPLAISSARVNATSSTESTVTTVATAWASGQGWEIASVTTKPDGVVIRATGPLQSPRPPA